MIQHTVFLKTRSELPPPIPLIRPSSLPGSWQWGLFSCSGMHPPTTGAGLWEDTLLKPAVCRPQTQTPALYSKCSKPSTFARRNVFPLPLLTVTLLQGVPLPVPTLSELHWCFQAQLKAHLLPSRLSFPSDVSPSSIPFHVSAHQALYTLWALKGLGIWGRLDSESPRNNEGKRNFSFIKNTGKAVFIFLRPSPLHSTKASYWCTGWEWGPFTALLPLPKPQLQAPLPCPWRQLSSDALSFEATPEHPSQRKNVVSRFIQHAPDFSTVVKTSGIKQTKGWTQNLLLMNSVYLEEGLPLSLSFLICKTGVRVQHSLWGTFWGLNKSEWSGTHQAP